MESAYNTGVRLIKTPRKVCLICMMLFLLILTGCAEQPEAVTPQGKAYFTYFDTVSYVYSYAGDSAEQFDNCSADVAVILEEYHQLFDIYHEYSGINNLCTINKNAGGEALVVDEKLIDFLIYAGELYDRTEGEMNIMMGAVTKLWHDCRSYASDFPDKASLPDSDALAEAAKHCDFSLLEIDKEHHTVRLTDPAASIDVGAVGKGYATEQAAQFLRSQGKEGYVLNIGGNIRIIGSKSDGSAWNTGIKNPFGDGFAANLLLKDTACVSSGNYERYYVVNGQRYHHIIDKDTLYPAEYFAAITIVTEDSGLADSLSTALFCMSHEDGLKLLETFPEVEVLWITEDGELLYTDGLGQMIQEK